MIQKAALLPYTDPTKRVERVRKSLRQALTSRPHTFRRTEYSVDQLFLAAARFWNEFSPNELYDTWLEILDDIGQYSRQDLLVTLAALAPIVKLLGGSEAQAAVVDAIDDVTRWWP